LEELLAEFATVRVELSGARQQLIALRGEAMGRFDKLDIGTQRILSRVDDAFTGLMRALTDEAKEGPRLFSLQPTETGFLDLPHWVSQKFRLTLWCEHSRLPLPFLNKGDMSHGIYEFDIPRDWFVKAAPFLKTLASILSLALPIASSFTKMAMDDEAYKAIQNQLDFGQKCLESALKGTKSAIDTVEELEGPDLPKEKAFRAQGAVLRQLQAWLKDKDPGFGGLVRVQNKRLEFLWVHPQFEKEY